jgi:prenyl protein peptidase
MSRDDPGQIRRRFVSVAVTSAAALALLRVLFCSPSDSLSFWALVGVRLDGVLAACVLTLFLTALLFLGPIVQFVLPVCPDDCGDAGSGDSGDPHGRGPVSWARRVGWTVSDLCWWRAFVVGPITEEVCFRACMVPVLLGAGFSTVCACVLPPLCFGLAHVHHVLQHLRDLGLVAAIATAVLQLGYTSLFGAFSCWLFIRTGHLLACILVHSFCNAMGLPDFAGALTHPRRFLLATLYVIGLISFILGLVPLTNPALFRQHA